MVGRTFFRRARLSPVASSWRRTGGTWWRWSPPWRRQRRGWWPWWRAASPSLLPPLPPLAVATPVLHRSCPTRTYPHRPRRTGSKRAEKGNRGVEKGNRRVEQGNRAETTERFFRAWHRPPSPWKVSIPIGRGGGSGQAASFRGEFVRSSGCSFGEKNRMGNGTPWAVRYHLQEYIRYII
jgi:hypothetical protein